MSTYVLIHGAWHGAWCWDKVVSLLRKNGQVTEALDLPGSGMDKTPISEVTLDAYVKKVCQVLDTQPEPVILVGHSLGGITITQAAEYRPKKIKKLVYLTAFLLQNGQSRISVRDQDPSTLARINTIYSKDKTYMFFRQEAIREVFYADCSDQDIARAKSLFCNQATAPLTTPLNLTEENFGQIPKVYIKCLNDKAISLSMQEKMCNATLCQKVLSLDTSHSPFLSAPEALTTHLLSLAD
jgi:pimeloyl-ACP methyl ester carboxylesterase